MARHEQVRPRIPLNARLGWTQHDWPAGDGFTPEERFQKSIEPKTAKGFPKTNEEGLYGSFKKVHCPKSLTAVGQSGDFSRWCRWCCRRCVSRGSSLLTCCQTPEKQPFESLGAAIRMIRQWLTEKITLLSWGSPAC